MKRFLPTANPRMNVNGRLNLYDRNNDEENQDHVKMASATKVLWGLGAFNSFGVNLHWKMVGLGYEYRTSSAEYKHFNTENFGKDKTKFKSGTSKFYITFRF